ncbi:MAG: DUF721 domain-containing protein [Desulfamplus sp.]|nr:DUF721 domain-containing protein [Desulfamplus sp.]MBF0388919.1 DUF721 domain-containing protein [Desulfamplus sp.]
MKGKLIHISEILDSILKNIRPSSDIGMTTIWQIWSTTVGDAIAKETKPGAFKDGNLIVHVSSSVWMQQLKYLKKDIIDKLNKYLNANMVRDIIFKIGNVDR